MEPRLYITISARWEQDTTSDQETSKILIETCR